MMQAKAYEILGNYHDAEDAVHQAFLTIAKNISRISEIKCPKTKAFIVTIVENKAIDLYRAKNRRAELPYDEETVKLHVEYSGTNELSRCISQLPARYRQVLILKYAYGYDWSEIAAMLGICANNAEKIAWRAKKKLEILCKEVELL